jgi:hypothetical protein
MGTVGPSYPSESEDRAGAEPEPAAPGTPPPTGSVPPSPSEPTAPQQAQPPETSASEAPEPPSEGSAGPPAAPPPPAGPAPSDASWTGTELSRTGGRAQVHARPRNGLGVAALVIGVASVVAGASFVLFPLAFVGGVIGLILGIIALGRRSQGATNQGQATAGVICSVLALLIAVVFTVRVGTWVSRNTTVFARFDRCIAQANDRAAVSDCIARFANEVRP